MRQFFRTNHVAQTVLLLLVLLMTSLVIGDGVLTPAQTGIVCSVLRLRSMTAAPTVPARATFLSHGMLIACVPALLAKAGSKSIKPCASYITGCSQCAAECSASKCCLSARNRLSNAKCCMWAVPELQKCCPHALD